MIRILGLFTLIALVLCFIVFSGCSGASSIPTSPVENPIVDTPQKESQSERMLLGMWQISYDRTSGELTPVPLRDADSHYNVTGMALPPSCSNCLTIHVNSVNYTTHIIDADVTLKNASSYTAYDVRFIVYTNNYGHELLGPDGWTSLWDVTGGQTINPFRAFAKSTANRAFVPSAQSIENFRITLPDPPQLDKITFAIDASIPSNCLEPYKITNFAQDTLFDSSGSVANITVDVLDWQNDANTVNLSCAAITGVDSIPLSKISGNTWGADIGNAASAAAGNYLAKVTATSTYSGSLALSDFFTITITEMPPWDGFAKTWGGTSNEQGNSVATDSSGNVYVTGSFSGTNVDFDPSNSSVDFHSSNGGSDVFLSKFNSLGAHQWSRTWGGVEDDEGNSVATDSLGYVYVTGYFRGTDVEFAPSPFQQDLHSSHGGPDVFITKFAPTASHEWAETWGGAVWYDKGYGVATDTSDNVYITGEFSGTNVDFDPGWAQDLHSGSNDAFLSKFNSSGSHQWAETWGDSGSVTGLSVATYGSSNLYVTGYYIGMTDFDPGPGEDLQGGVAMDLGGRAFVSNFNLNGVYQWVRVWGSTDKDMSAEAKSVTTDSSGNFYVVGGFSGKDVEFGVDTLSSSHYWSEGEQKWIYTFDAYITKFNISGTIQWARNWADNAYGVDTDSSGNVYVTGYFGGSQDFDPGSGSDFHYGQGDSDVYISKFSPGGAFGWALTWGGTSADRGYGVATDNSGYVYVTGSFASTVDFDPWGGVENHTSNGSSDAFLSILPAGG